MLDQLKIISSLLIVLFLMITQGVSGQQIEKLRDKEAPSFGTKIHLNHEEKEVRRHITDEEEIFESKRVLERINQSSNSLRFVQQAASTDDSLMLVNFYHSLNGDDWLNNDNWLEGPLDTWYGIYLNSEGRVDWIVLQENNLTGSIPDDIGSLTELLVLALGGNSISGSIPIGIGALSNLEILYLEVNEIGGELPLELGQLSKLEEISLSSNNLEGSIPEGVLTAPQLTYLSLSANNLSGILPDAFESTQKLEILFISRNKLSGSIPASISNLKSLTQISLYGNKLTGEIPAELGRLDSLSYLSLNSNSLNGTLPKELGNLKKLGTLSLHGNQITGEIPAELGQLENLMSLSLYSNSLSGAIPEALLSLPSLEYLSLSDNNISGVIPDNFDSSQKLETLYISRNQLTGNLPKSIGSLKSLTELSLYANNLSGTIPIEIIELENLTDLNLRDNFELCEPSDYSFDIWVSGLSTYNRPLGCPLSVSEDDSLALVTLYQETGGVDWTINSKWLEGPVAHWYGVGVYDGVIEWIDLNNNNLVGTIPEELGKIESLAHLRLYSNQLSGSIPEELFDLKELKVLWMSSNELSGEIPSAMDSLVNLQYFYVHNNQLAGMISSAIGDLPSLVGLSLYNNDLIGTIPAELGQLSQLEVLYLFGNQLTGELPYEIGELSSLRELYISDNNFEGDLPYGLGSLQNLRGLAIDGNFFTSLPDFYYTENLALVNVSNNQLTFGDLIQLVDVPDAVLGPQKKLGIERNIVRTEKEYLSIDFDIHSNYKDEYVWMKDGSVLEEEISDVLRINSLDSTHSGVYQLIISNENFADFVIESHLQTVKVNRYPVANDAEFTLPENSANGSSVGIVEASDPDGDKVSFTITYGNIANAFAINESTGALTVANTEILDYENISEFNLGIEVTDLDGKSSHANILISLLDLSDGQPDLSCSISNYQILNTSWGDYRFVYLNNQLVYVQNGSDEYHLKYENGQLVYLTDSYDNGLSGGNTVNRTYITYVDDKVDKIYYADYDYTDSFYYEGGRLVRIESDIYDAENPYTEGVFYEYVWEEDEIISSTVGGYYTLETGITDYIFDNELNPFYNNIAYFLVGVLDDPVQFLIPNNVKRIIGNGSAYRYSYSYQDNGLPLGYILTDEYGDQIDEVVFGYSNCGNQTPIIANQAFIIDENIKEGDIVGKVEATDKDGDLLTYFLLQGSDYTFKLDSSNGTITVRHTDYIDYDDRQFFDLQIGVIDGQGGFSSANISIQINDINTFPEMPDYAFSVYENRPQGTVIGYISPTDVDGDFLYYYIISGDPDGNINIDKYSEPSPSLKVGWLPLDFETTPYYDLEILVEDEHENSVISKIRIDVIDINENVNNPPIIEDQSFSIPENLAVGSLVGKIEVFDPEMDEFELAIIDWQEDDPFTIGTGGKLYVLNAGSLDFEKQVVFSLEIEAKDSKGAISNATISVNLLDVDESTNTAPAITDQTFSLADNSSVSTVVGTVQASDADGDALSYAITSGNTNDAFALNATSGELTVQTSTALDFETTPVFNLEIEVNDGKGGIASATITINLTDVDESTNTAPTISAQTFSLAENSAASTVVGTLQASDADGDALSYTINSGNANDAFALDATSGVLTVQTSSALDFETFPTFNLEVEVNDGNGGIASATITINLTDIDESTNTAPTISTQTFSLAENSAASTVVGTIQASDSDGDALSYSIISGNTDDAFSLNASSGELIVQTSSALDFETTPAFSLEVEVNDGNDGIASATITVNLTDVDESSNTPPTIVAQTFNIEENSVVGELIGTVEANDSDGDELTFTILSGNNGNAFEINANTGQIKVKTKSALNYEVYPDFALLIEVNDGNGGVASATITINLIDIFESTNKPPVLEDQTVSLVENSPERTQVAYVFAEDEDNNYTELTYELISGNETLAFNFSPFGTGRVLTVNDASQMDYEITQIFVVQIRVTDPSGGSDVATITINVTDVNEMPSLESAELSIDENSIEGVLVATLMGVDPDGDALSYTITSGNTNNAFALNATSGALTVLTSSALDFETTPTFNLEVEVSDGNGGTASATITINLTDVDENLAPTISDQTFSLAENSTSMIEVGTIQATDPNGDVLSYSITSGNTGDAFSLNATSGILTVQTSTALDFETTPTFNLEVKVNDGNGGTASATITINLTNVDESLLLPATFEINENSSKGTLIGSIGYFESSTTLQPYFVTDQINQNDEGLVNGLDMINAGALVFSAENFDLIVDNPDPFDFEQITTFKVQVALCCVGSEEESTVTFTVNLKNVNEAPSLSDAAFTLEENSEGGISVGMLMAEDEDGDALSFSIEAGNTGDAFALNAGTGELTVQSSSALDFETTPSFNLEVRVTDGNGGTATAVIIINLTDVNENVSPVLNSQQKVELSIYPNPTTGFLKLNLLDHLIGKEIQISDLSGKVIIDKTIGLSVTELDIRAYPNGIYLLRIGDQVLKITKAE